jgi:hypothetical protein
MSELTRAEEFLAVLAVTNRHEPLPMGKLAFRDRFDQWCRRACEVLMPIGLGLLVAAFMVHS